jgi:hypothetical protein
VLNVGLKLFGAAQDNAIEEKGMSTAKECEKEAYVGNQKKESGGCLTVVKLIELMPERGVNCHVITGEFEKEFLDTRDPL